MGQWVAGKVKDRTHSHVPLRDKWVLPIVVEGYRSLLREIQAVRPNLILTFGNYPMWALTGRWGITKWRGSMLEVEDRSGWIPAGRPDGGLRRPKVLPTYHPAAILREWSWRAIGILDLRRAAGHLGPDPWPVPDHRFLIRPSFEAVIFRLDGLIERAALSASDPLWLEFDIETAVGHTGCVGISWSRTEALCIPLTAQGKPDGYWSLEEEAAIVSRLHRLLTHPWVRVRGQNLLYDCQYTWRHWHFVPRVAQDTMIAQHSCFSALPKGLGFLGSMYARHYVYWKDEGKQL
jgi:hypothetical protein